jgi:Lrp/AsnC family transcriptional regulator, leucine-responsive regulatory protein
MLVSMSAIVVAASEIPEVQELFAIAGEPDALARIRVHDVEHLKHVVNNCGAPSTAPARS